jgi:hypothetical protein
MTHRSKIGVVVLLSATMVGWAQGARADHFTGSCGSELNAVEAAIESAVFLGNKATTEESNLLAKLEAAHAKILLGKFSDAVDKLQDISDRATALADAPKPKLEDATGINGAVVDAIACVGAL